MNPRANALMTLTTALTGLLLLIFSACSFELGASAADISIDEAWARAGEAGHNSAAYMVIRNDGRDSDRLVGASSDVAGAVEVHESTGEHGTMKMREVEEIEIGAGDSVALEPGGYHVMLMDLAHDLTPGDDFSLALTFEHAGTIEIDVPVDDDR